MDNQYISDFQIIGTSVKKIKISNNFINLPDGPNVKRSFDISHSVITVDCIEEEKIITGLLQLNIKLKISGAQKLKYNLEFSIEGCFQANIEMGEDTFQQMLQVNGVTSLYSISRAIIQSISSQTLVSGNIILPMINVLEYSKNLDLNTQQAKTQE